MDAAITLTFLGLFILTILGPLTGLDLRPLRSKGQNPFVPVSCRYQGFGSVHGTRTIPRLQTNLFFPNPCSLNTLYQIRMDLSTIFNWIKTIGSEKPAGLTNMIRAFKTGRLLWRPAHYHETWQPPPAPFFIVH